LERLHYQVPSRLFQVVASVFGNSCDSKSPFT
jgi:hypothetical protein